MILASRRTVSNILSAKSIDCTQSSAVAPGFMHPVLTADKTMPRENSRSVKDIAPLGTAYHKLTGFDNAKYCDKNRQVIGTGLMARLQKNQEDDMKNCVQRMAENHTDEKIAAFHVKQKMPYEFKINYARIRAIEFRDECERRGLNYHVSVGGLDIITLYLFLHSIGIDAPGISVSYLEDRSIQKIHKSLGLERLQSAIKPDGTHWIKPEVLQTFGFPVLSKEMDGKDGSDGKTD